MFYYFILHLKFYNLWRKADFVSRDEVCFPGGKSVSPIRAGLLAVVRHFGTCVLLSWRHCSFPRVSCAAERCTPDYCVKTLPWRALRNIGFAPSVCRHLRRHCGGSVCGSAPPPRRPQHSSDSCAPAPRCAFRENTLSRLLPIFWPRLQNWFSFHLVRRDASYVCSMTSY